MSLSRKLIRSVFLWASGRGKGGALHIAVMVVLSKGGGEDGAVWLADHDVYSDLAAEYGGAFHFAARAESGLDAVYFLIKGGGGRD